MLDFIKFNFETCAKCGLFEYCVTDEYEPLLKILNISQDRVVTAGLSIGYQLYSFKRKKDPCKT